MELQIKYFFHENNCDTAYNLKVHFACMQWQSRVESGFSTGALFLSFKMTPNFVAFLTKNLAEVYIPGTVIHTSNSPCNLLSTVVIW